MMRNRFLAAATATSLAVSLVVAPSADAAQVSEPENKICSVDLTPAEKETAKKIRVEAKDFYGALTQAHLNASEEIYPGSKAVGQEILRHPDFKASTEAYASDLMNSPAELGNKSGEIWHSFERNEAALKGTGMSEATAREYVYALYFVRVGHDAYDLIFPRAFEGQIIPAAAGSEKQDKKIEPWAFRVGGPYSRQHVPKFTDAVAKQHSDYWLVTEHVSGYVKALEGSNRQKYKAAIRKLFESESWKKINELELALSQAALNCWEGNTNGRNVAFPVTGTKPSENQPPKEEPGQGNNANTGDATDKPGRVDDGDEGSSLSTPAIIGIVVAVIAALGALGAAWFNFMGNTPAFKLPF